MTDCIFCEILAGHTAGSFVYRDELCSAFMDAQPVTTGHVLVVPNQHATHLADLPPETGAHMFRTAQQLAAGLRASGLRCEGVNFFVADGRIAGQTVFHVHLHIIPRYAGDGFGFRFGPNYGTRPVRAELDQLAEQIKLGLGKEE